MDVAAILNIGVIGLSFLLAVLAFRLLAKKSLTSHALTNVRWFLAFSLAVCLLGLVSEWMRRTYDVEVALLRSRLMTANQAITIQNGASAYATARSELDRIPALVERSCSGGPSGKNPENYPVVLEATNTVRDRLTVVQSALDLCGRLAPP